MFEIGVYNDYCKDWRKKDDEDQTWDTFKTFFTKANQDLRDSGTTARSAGYQANNISVTNNPVEDTSQEVQALEAIANLAIFLRFKTSPLVINSIFASGKFLLVLAIFSAGSQP